jgi:molybdopterin-guanine dinucleotide biosynthesis protein A
VHKPAIVVGGRTLLDRVLSVLVGAGPDEAASPLIVVGPPQPQPLPPHAVLTREEPAGGGPVAALAAGLAALPAGARVTRVALLAADLPFLTTQAVTALREACSEAVDGAVLVDADGREQYLAGVWRVASLQRALSAFGDPTGGSMRRLVAGLQLAKVAARPGPDGTMPWFDCDDPGDLARAKGWA